MNRIDRLFAILLTLQHRRRVRALDLAEQFEVSKRTIYRDMSALNQMGIPIAAMPGEGFELVEGYYIPPLMFTENEAVALILGSRLLTQQAAGSLTKGADQALAKITVALPEQLRARAEALTNIISFITPDEKFNLDDPQLLTLQKSIQQKRVIHIRYHAYQKDEVTERDVEPHQLFYSDGVWYLEGYCRWRKDIRAFRLSRIEKLSARSETFSKRRAGKPQNAKTIEIKIRFKPEAVRWVRERQHYGFHREEPATATGITMIYRVHDASEIVPWILSWGAAAEVLSPRELRKSLRETARRLADLLT
ncbi:MAG TPA: YafY family protein [Anaerolineales bacterium]|nr:YafY family protein [Anaerolineales bacterium]